MTPGARLAAAIEVFSNIEAQRRPAADALKDWGLAHRFAGSKDRAAIAALVYDALRRRASSAWIMGEETPRAILLGALREARGLDAETIAALCGDAPHAPPALSDAERERLATATLEDAPAHVRGDYPHWLASAFEAVFGEAAVEEGQALAQRAPLDLRVNVLKGDRERAQARLAHLEPAPTPWSPWGLRIRQGADGRAPALQAETAFLKGLVEVQDEGSQLASLLSGAAPGQQVLDLCAGGGGKTLALAALMENHGQIYATDRDLRRLAPIHARLERAGARNVQVRAPRGRADVLADLNDRCDLVVVDAPCTGVGAWRRNPDAKWRTRESALERRIVEQDEILDEAARYVKPGGALLYITCSLLREENEDRVAAFLTRDARFAPRDAKHMARKAGLSALEERASRFGPGLRLSPRATGTDGFYIAALARL